MTKDRIKELALEAADKYNSESYRSDPPFKTLHEAWEFQIECIEQALQTCEAEVREEYKYLFKLMQYDQAFISGQDWREPCLLMNDTFGFATADAEPFEINESKVLWELYEKHGESGLIVWVSLRRNIKPIIKMANFEEIVNEIRKGTDEEA